MADPMVLVARGGGDVRHNLVLRGRNCGRHHYLGGCYQHGLSMYQESKAEKAIETAQEMAAATRGVCATVESDRQSERVVVGMSCFGKR